MSVAAQSSASLWISLASAAISCSILAWQVALFRLSGHRIRVILNPAAIDANDTIWRTEKLHQWINPAHRMRPLSWPRDSTELIELAEITVANVGRAPVTVRAIELEFGRQRRRLRRSRRTAAGIFVASQKSIAELPHRLEPGDALTAFFDLWAFAPTVVDEQPKDTCVVRASATIGYRATRRSRSRWRLAKGQQSFANEPLTRNAAVFRALFRALTRPDPDESETFQDRLARVSITYYTLLPNLKSNITRADIREQLKDLLPDSRHFAVAWAVWEALAAFPGESEDGEKAPPRG